MKTFKKTLRYWFLSASLVTFLGGWLMLAHSPKPIQPVQNSSFNLASFFQDSGGTNRRRDGLNLLTSRSHLSSGFPMLRTGGS